MGRRGRARKRAAQAAAHANKLKRKAVRNEAPEPQASSQHTQDKPAPLQIEVPRGNPEPSKGESAVSEPSKWPARLSPRVLWSGLVTAIGLMAAAIALYQIRPILSIPSPPYMVFEKIILSIPIS